MIILAVAVAFNYELRRTKLPEAEVKTAAKGLQSCLKLKLKQLPKAYKAA